MVRRRRCYRANRLESPAWLRADVRHQRLRHRVLQLDDLTKTGEDAAEATIAASIDVGTARLDVTNEARVHTWYEQRFGRPLSPYRSTEHAIATWPTTATSVGVRSDDNGFKVCAPFGLTDLFAMVVRPNVTLVSQATYEAKAERWRQIWPRLTVLPWPTR